MSDQSKPSIIQELRATAQLMTLEPGVFCVFHPGQAMTDPSGLPGVRISLPPSASLSPGHVQISTFRDDGWLGGADSAALIRVNGGRPGQVLVTVYQAQNGAEAPRLQVVRLTDVPQPAAAPPQGQAQPQADVRSGPPVGAAMLPAGAGGQRLPEVPQQPPADQAEVAAHINRMGDVLSMLGQWVGERGSKRWIEGFALSPKSGLDPADIEYQAVLGRDWLSPWSEGGQYCGSRGMSLPLLGLRVRLRGAAAERFDVQLEASFVNGASVGPVPAGEACETPELAALEAFRLVVAPRAAVAAPKPAPKPAPAAVPEAAAAKPARRARAPEPTPEPEPAPKRSRKAAAPPPPPPPAPAPRGGSRGNTRGGTRRR